MIKDLCHRCHGKGHHEQGRECANCGGTGWVKSLWRTVKW